jgi:hypothetical protein
MNRPVILQALGQLGTTRDSDVEDHSSASVGFQTRREASPGDSECGGPPPISRKRFSIDALQIRATPEAYATRRIGWTSRSASARADAASDANTPMCVSR